MRLLKFQADWCGPCKAIAPKVKARAEAEGWEVEELDVDTVWHGVVEKWGVRGVPTLILLGDDGEELGRGTGLNALDQIDKALES